MSTNLRKAQKHMQRAKELLNQSQLGFGVETRSNKRKLAQEKIEILCSICFEDITDKDMADVHYCHPVENKVDSTIKTVPEHWFCKNCLEQWINAGYDNCPNCKGPCIALLTKNKVRLRSIRYFIMRLSSIMTHVNLFVSICGSFLSHKICIDKNFLPTWQKMTKK